MSPLHRQYVRVAFRHRIAEDERRRQKTLLIQEVFAKKEAGKCPIQLGFRESFLHIEVQIFELAMEL
jgi:hypothetical protein